MSEISDIRERISALKLELQDYSQRIVSHVEILHAPNISKTPVDFKNDPRNAVRVLRTDVLELLEDSKENTTNFTSESKQELSDCSSLVDILSKVVALTETMSTCDQCLSSSNLTKTIDLMESMEERLADLPAAASEYGSGKLCSLLRREVGVMKGRFLARLRRLFNECVTVECGRIYVAKALEGMVRGEDVLIEEPIRLQDILVALEKTDASHEVVDALALSIWRDILKPLWKEKKMIAAKTFSNEDRAELVYENVVREDLTSASLKQEDGDLRPSPWLVASDSADLNAPGGSRAPFVQLLEQIGISLSFLWNELLWSNHHMAQQAASVLSSKAPIISHLVNTVVSMMPKQESDLAAFQKPFEKSYRDFESKMRSCGVFGSTLLADVSLKGLVEDISGKFACVRRRDTLVRARELILADYHNTMLGTGSALEDDPSTAGCVGDPRAIIEQSGSFMQTLRFEACQISMAACRVLKLIHEVLQQVTHSKESRLIHSLYNSSRECLELFLAIVPIRYAETLRSSQKMAAVFFNDCAYIAHNCTVITNMYREEIGKVNPDLKETLGFLDFIPRFRNEGEKGLMMHVEMSRSTILGLIENRVRINPYVRDATAGFNDEGGVALVIGEFEGCKKQDVVYERVLGHLLECALRGVMQPVLESDCISQSSGSEVCRIFGSLQQVKSLFGNPIPDQEQMMRLAASWNKFITLTDLLEYSLSEISEMLSAAKFASFTESEICSLIKALFEDSPKRKAVLSAIQDRATIANSGS